MEQTRQVKNITDNKRISINSTDTLTALCQHSSLMHFALCAIYRPLWILAASDIWKLERKECHPFVSACCQFKKMIIDAFTDAQALPCYALHLSLFKLKQKLQWGKRRRKVGMRKVMCGVRSVLIECWQPWLNCWNPPLVLRQCRFRCLCDQRPAYRGQTQSVNLPTLSQLTDWQERKKKKKISVGGKTADILTCQNRKSTGVNNKQFHVSQ